MAATWAAVHDAGFLFVLEVGHVPARIPMKGLSQAQSYLPTSDSRQHALAEYATKPQCLAAAFPG